MTALFGCPMCFQDAPEALWAARPWQPERQLIEDSHFGVTICACGACGQRFVKVFTEFVDWQGGEDPQHWDVVPLRPDEAEDLSRQGEQVSLQQIGRIGGDRQRLQVDYPKGEPLSVRFVTGPFLVMPGY